MKTMDSNKPIHFLREKKLIRFWSPALWFLVGNFSVALIMFHFLPGDTGKMVWAITLVLALPGAGMLILATKRNAYEIAKALDRQHASHNRLEAVVELSKSKSPLALAQRNETAASLAILKRDGHNDLTFSITLPSLLCLILIFANTWTATIWLRNTSIIKTTEELNDLPQSTVSIRWIKPHAETKATKVEEVPLRAEVNSNTGLTSITLEVAVNGENKKSIRIPENPFDKPGTYLLDISLYLDELEVEPYDSVSYYLEAKRIIHGDSSHEKPLPPTTSEMQFVEVRPFREDAVIINGDQNFQSASLLTKLKKSQLGLLKLNFILDKSELSTEDPVWISENTRIGKEQSTLAAKTNQTIARLVLEGAQAGVIDLLVQAIPNMEAAAVWILNAENSRATPAQAASLALITQCQKYLAKSINENAKNEPKEEVSDPFKDEQQFKLPSREKTEAGKMETAAAEQMELAEELKEFVFEASQSSSEESQSLDTTNKETSTDLSKRQRSIADKIREIAKIGGVPEIVKDLLTEAGKSAADTIQQLEANDPEAARQPSAQAAADLKAAVETLNSTSESYAEEILEQVQRGLNAAAKELSKSNQNSEAPSHSGSDFDLIRQSSLSAARKVDGIRTTLKNEARRQQEQGSSRAASEIAKIADAIEQSGAIKDIQMLSENLAGDPGKIADRLEELAKKAASTVFETDNREQKLEQLIEVLHRVQTNLNPTHSGTLADQLAMQEEMMSDLQVAAQTAEVRSSQAKTGEAAKALQIAIDNAYSKTSYTEQTHDLGVAIISRHGQIPPAISNLISQIHAELKGNKRMGILAGFRPDDAPLEYQEPVAKYFEQLSRDYEKPSIPPNKLTP